MGEIGQEVLGVASGPGCQPSASAADASSQSGIPNARVVHLRNGRAGGHPRTFGEGITWCGKKLLGKPESSAGGVDVFSSYGVLIHATFDPDDGSCAQCSTAFEVAYASAFPEGPKPIATFKLDDPADLERANALLSAEAMTRYFGPGGAGMAAFDADLRASAIEARSDETRSGSAEGESAGPKDDAQPGSEPVNG